MRAVAIVALFCFTGAAAAEEKKAKTDEKKPTGAWTKKAEGFDIKFAFKKGDVMFFSMASSNESCEMENKCTYGKDGVVKCKVTKYTKNGNFPEIKEGFEFSFKFTPKDKTAKISDLEASGVEEAAKAVVEGEYEKATD
jgi:hypothetical protein